MRWNRNKKAKPQARLVKCFYCSKQINLDGFDYVVDGAGEILHSNCFTLRWGLTKEKQKSHAD